MMVKALAVILLLLVIALGAVVRHRPGSRRSVGEDSPAAAHDRAAVAHVPSAQAVRDCSLLLAAAAVAQARAQPWQLDPGAKSPLETVGGRSRAALPADRPSPDEVLGGQAPDEARTQAIRDSIEALRGKGGMVDSELVDASCSASICRVTLKSSSAEAQNVAGYDFTNSGIGGAERSLLYDREKLLTTIYVEGRL